MLNTRFIFKYRKEVKLIQTVLALVNVTQSDRVGRIYHNFFEVGVGSDQDFFESINWYARKCIRIAAERSLRASRKLDFDDVRYWNSVIIVITPLLGDRPWKSVDDLINIVDLMLNDRL